MPPPNEPLLDRVDFFVGQYKRENGGRSPSLADIANYVPGISNRAHARDTLRSLARRGYLVLVGGMRDIALPGEVYTPPLAWQKRHADKMGWPEE